MTAYTQAQHCYALTESRHETGQHQTVFRSQQLRQYADLHALIRTTQTATLQQHPEI